MLFPNKPVGTRNNDLGHYQEALKSRAILLHKMGHERGFHVHVLSKKEIKHSKFKVRYSLYSKKGQECET